MTRRRRCDLCGRVTDAYVVNLTADQEGDPDCTGSTAERTDDELIAEGARVLCWATCVADVEAGS